jgi:hypothetical protein
LRRRVILSFEKKKNADENCPKNVSSKIPLQLLSFKEI